jgi:hypothetical protein
MYRPCLELAIDFSQSLRAGDGRRQQMGTDSAASPLLDLVKLQKQPNVHCSWVQRPKNGFLNAGSDITAGILELQRTSFFEAILLYF